MAMISSRPSVPGRARAFSLVELLVVIAILALLVSILIPSLRGAKELTRRVICSSNIRQLATAHKNYETAYQGVFPRARDYLTVEEPGVGSVSSITGWPNLPNVPRLSILIVGHYMSESLDCFKCPGDDGHRKENPTYQWIKPPSFSFTRNGQINGLGPAGYPRTVEIRRPEDTALLVEEWEEAPFNDSYVVANQWDLITQRHLGRASMAFFDGHAETIDSKTFNEQNELWRCRMYLDP